VQLGSLTGSVLRCPAPGSKITNSVARKAMRVITAAFFVWGSMIAAAFLLIETGLMDGGPQVLVGLVLGSVLLFASIVAVFLFNPWWANPLGLRKPEDILRRLEDEGLLDSSDFQALRAFGFEDYDAEAGHYFLELVDGRILSLCGQYLYDFEPISDDPDLNQPRLFPCTDFSIRRHRTGRYVVELICRGAVIEPDFLALPYRNQKKWSGRSFGDGQLISDTTYDALQALMLEDSAES
jgi:hypothetical protein